MPFLKSLAVLALGIVLALWALGAFVDNPPLPKLVASMTGDFYGNDPEFPRRVTAAYPTSVSLAVMTKNLSDQGYIIKENTAVFEEDFFACRSTWTIYWQVEGDKATRINGGDDLACP